MEVKPGYKQTEVGVIPEEWEVTTIIDCCDYADYRGKTPPKTQSGTFLVTARNVRKGFIDYVDSQEFVPSALYDQIMRRGKPRIGDVLITTEAPLGNVAQIDREDVALAQRIIKYRPKSDELSSTYLKHYFLSDRFQQVLDDHSSGSTAKGIKGRVLHQLPVVIPPLPEQRAIAMALSDVDGLLGGLDRLIAKKRDLKQAAMQQLLTGQTRLPGFHNAWEVSTVAELEKMKLVKLSRGQVISKKDIDNTPGDFPIYSSSIHNDGLFGRYGDFMFDEELITWSVDGGGNFFHRRKHKFSVTNVCGFMRVDTSRIDYRFFAAELQLLHSRKSFDYQSKAHPSVIRKEYEVQLPPLPEQTAIAEVLTEMDAELTALEQRREKTRALKQAVMQELLTGRTRLV